MEFILLILSNRGEAPRAVVGLPEMGKYAQELGASGQLRGGAPLYPEDQGARLRVSRGRAEVIDGPFAESKEVIGGFFLFEARDRAEALELAERCPAHRSGHIELHAVDREVGRPSAPGVRFMLLFRQSELHNDPDGSKRGKMDQWIDGLKRDGTYVECAGLSSDPAPARLETRAAKTAVVDGPFAETKEVLGGYLIALVRDRAEALELAKRSPHATWGTVEVREIVALPPPV